MDLEQIKLSELAGVKYWSRKDRFGDKKNMALKGHIKSTLINGTYKGYIFQSTNNILSTGVESPR